MIGVTVPSLALTVAVASYRVPMSGYCGGGASELGLSQSTFQAVFTPTSWSHPQEPNFSTAEYADAGGVLAMPMAAIPAAATAVNAEVLIFKTRSFLERCLLPEVGHQGIRT
jgi:hypothetical protein